jgi:hypothetical protein
MRSNTDYIFEKIGYIRLEQVLNYFQSKGWKISEQPRFHRYYAQLLDDNAEELDGVFIPNDPAQKSFKAQLYSTLSAIARIENRSLIEILNLFVPDNPTIQVNVIWGASVKPSGWLFPRSGNSAQKA